MYKNATNVPTLTGNDAYCTKHGSYPQCVKRNWCTKRTDCTKRSKNNHEWSQCAKKLLGVPTKTLSVLTGVPNVKCSKLHQMYQNPLGMMPTVLKSDSFLGVPKCN